MTMVMNALSMVFSPIWLVILGGAQSLARVWAMARAAAAEEAAARTATAAARVVTDLFSQSISMFDSLCMR